LSSADHEKALVAWSNTSLGILLHWWHGNKQQSGRSSIGKSALPSLVVLDVGALSQSQLKAAVSLFDDLSKRPLRPIHELDVDPIRAELDTRFARDVLDLPTEVYATSGHLNLLRMKLAREPSVRGHKKS
jgi:hypothetical protein